MMVPGPTSRTALASHYRGESWPDTLPCWHTGCVFRTPTRGGPVVWLCPDHAADHRATWTHPAARRTNERTQPW